MTRITDRPITASELTAEFMATPPTPALHPGAAKYYKEAGLLK